MSNKFAELVEDVKRLSPDEKQQLHDLLGNYLIQERRQEIFDNYQSSLEELDQGKLTFTTDTNALREMMSNG